ncbi:MAG TPA: TolC family protein [Blastocatellia bacterium]|nr:TolC family protein [Blastocatellia bacterium]
MGILLKVVALLMAVCAAAMAQNPVIKTQIPDQDLSNNPLLTPRRLPAPPVPDLTRLGVAGGLLPLSLNEAIRLALENNNDIEVSRDDVRIAEAALRSLKGVYDPIFNFNNVRLTQSIAQIPRETANFIIDHWPLYTDVTSPSVNVPGGANSNSSGTIRERNITFSPTLTRQFSAGGGQYKVFFDNQRTTSNSPITSLSPFYSVDVGVLFTQPLLRNRSIDIYRRDIRIQRKRLTQSDFDFRLSVIAVIAQAQQAYWELVYALRDQRNQISSLNLAREQLHMIEERVSVGASAPLERAQALTQIATSEINLLTATQYVTTTENTLKQLILRDPTDAAWSTQIEPIDQPPLAPTPVNLQDALAEAFTNRPELNSLRLQQDINGIDIQYYRNQTLPRFDAQSTISTAGFAGSPLQRPFITGDPTNNSTAFLFDQINQLRGAVGQPPLTTPPASNSVPGNLIGGYFRALGNVWDFHTVTFGLAIEVPIRNRTAKANLAGARIQGEQLAAQVRALEQTIEVDVRNAAQAVDITRRQILAAQAARESAEIQLAGEQKRYRTGLSTTFLVLQFQNQLVNARTAEIRAEANYNQAIANLQRATATTLRANNVTVKTPSTP